MAFAILRTKKLKSAPSIRGAGGHNARTRQTPNADPQKKNVVLVDGGNDLYGTVMKKIRSAEIKRKIRKDAVLAQEVFLSASPEYFRHEDPGQAGKWDKEKMKAWEKASMAWLQENFGENMIDCQLHLDESTPHMHAIVVPLVKDIKKDVMRLSAKEVFSKLSLREMQTSYAQATADIGLQRGIPGSKAKHTDIQKFYKMVEDTTRATVPKIDPPGRMLREQTRQEYADGINEFLAKEWEPVLAKANFFVSAKKQKIEYQATAAALSEENLRLQDELELATEAARDVPLDLVLEKAGLDPNPKDREQWLGGGHQINVTGQKWFAHNRGQDGGGAIDLVMHLNQYNFHQAVAWLGQKIDIDAAGQAIRAQAQTMAERFKDIDLKFTPPDPAPEHLPALKKWLQETRGLDPALTDSLIDHGSIYATEYKGDVNAVFLARNSKGINGAEEVKGLSGDFSGMTTGSNRKAGAFCIGNHLSKRAVFVKSALDALAYGQLHPDRDCYIISTAGATTKPCFVDELVENGWALTVAYDNDEIGRAFAEKFKENYPHATVEFPEKKNWNDDLIAAIGRPYLDLSPESDGPSM